MMSGSGQGGAGRKEVLFERIKRRSPSRMTKCDGPLPRDAARDLAAHRTTIDWDGTRDDVERRRARKGGALGH